MTSQPGFASWRAARPLPTEREEPAVDARTPCTLPTQPAQDPEPQPPPLRSLHQWFVGGRLNIAVNALDRQWQAGGPCSPV
jgi:hypothetical protein